MGLLVLLLPILLLSTYIVVKWYSGASSANAPQSVIVSNITSKSVTISWITEHTIDGSVQVEIGSKLKDFPDIRGPNTTSRIHYVELEDLTPDTTYAFKIKSGSNSYDKEITDFVFKTAPMMQESPIPDPLFGESPQGDTVIYITAKEGSTVLSGLTNSSERWIIDGSALRSKDLKAAKSIGPDDEIILFAVDADGRGVIHEGTRSDLFSTSGELKDDVSLKTADSVDIMSIVPDDFKFTSSGGGNNGGGNNGGGNNGGGNNGGGNNGGGNNGGGNNGGGNNGGGNNGGGNNGGGNNGGGNNGGGNNGGGNNGNISIPPRQPFDPAQREFIDGKQDVQIINMFDNVHGGGASSIPVGSDTVEVVNLAPTTFGVVWLTRVATPGYVIYGTSADELSENAPDQRDSTAGHGSYHAHFAVLEDLDANTQYLYDVNSGNSVYDNAGSHYRQKTTIVSDTPPTSHQISGTVRGLDDPTDAVVVAQVVDKDDTGSAGKSSLVGVIPDGAGNWIMDLGNLRDENGDFYEITEEDELTIRVIAYAESQDLISTVGDLQMIEDNSYDINVTPIEDTSLGGDYHVRALDDYGVHSSPIASGTGTGGTYYLQANDHDYAIYGKGGLSYTSDPSGQTPNTGISKGLYASLLTGGLLTVMGLMLARAGRGRKAGPTTKSLFNKI